MPKAEKSVPDRVSTGPRAPDVFGIVGTTQCGSFHVERSVAEGGFAVVYRALHGAFRAPVALKCLKMPVSLNAAQRAEFLEKFRAEAELMFRLSASIPEVVRPLHVDHFIAPDGRFVPFIALEWLDGEPLSAVIDRRSAQGKPPVSLRRAIELLTPIARALHRAHNFPGPDGPVAVIHCDVKPDNLFVIEIAGEPALKILDFGVAKARSLATARAGGVTGSETNVFTPSYAAPEQWVPQKYGQTGPWTDVYAFALSTLELILGRPPIEGEMHVMLAAAIDDQRRPTPRTLGVELPDRAEKAFASAVAVDPKARIQTVEAFWSELERALGLAPSLGRGLSSLIGGAPADLPSREATPSKARKNLESEPPPPALELDLPMSSPGVDMKSVRPPPRSPAPAASAAGEEFDLPSAPASRHPSGKRPLSVRPPGAALELDTEPIQVRRTPPVEVDATLGQSHSRLAPAVAARRAARGEGTVLGVEPSGPLIPSWLYVPLFLGLLAAGVTAADLYSVSATGHRLQVEGIQGWWVAVGLFAGSLVLAVGRALSR
jgi:serine/threonine protein kinase